MIRSQENEKYNFNTIFVHHYNRDHGSWNYNYIIFNQNQKNIKEAEKKTAH